jgi:prepilin-type N-terminal cleavage/methylation domain-containing protein
MMNKFKQLHQQVWGAKNNLGCTQGGFTLVEVMIASALMVGVAMALSQLMVEQGLRQKQMNTKMQFDTVTNNLDRTSGSPSAIVSSEQVLE